MTQRLVLATSLGRCHARVATANTGYIVQANCGLTYGVVVQVEHRVLVVLVAVVVQDVTESCARTGNVKATGAANGILESELFHEMD